MSKKYKPELSLNLIFGDIEYGVQELLRSLHPQVKLIFKNGRSLDGPERIANYFTEQFDEEVYPKVVNYDNPPTDGTQTFNCTLRYNSRKFTVQITLKWDDENGDLCKIIKIADWPSTFP